MPYLNGKKINIVFFLHICLFNLDIAHDAAAKHYFLFIEIEVGNETYILSNVNKKQVGLFVRTTCTLL